MDPSEWAVLIGGIAAIAGVLFYFFGPGRDGDNASSR